MKTIFLQNTAHFLFLFVNKILNQRSTILAERLALSNVEVSRSGGELKLETKEGEGSELLFNYQLLNLIK